MQKITPCLWFNMNAEEAVNFYCSIFKSAKKLGTSYYSEGMHQPAGKVLTITFELEGQKYLALNGGPEFPFTNAVSFLISCTSQAEIDYYWNKLLEGGEAQECGWLKDKFGLSWQIAPDFIEEVLNGSDKARAARMMQQVMTMVKLDYDKMKAA